MRIDNELSDECTVVEVFTVDRRGLLYRLARALHDLGLVIRFAKIGTYLDQVVDVFYVTERDGAEAAGRRAAGRNPGRPDGSDLADLSRWPVSLAARIRASIAWHIGISRFPWPCADRASRY